MNSHTIIDPLLLNSTSSNVIVSRLKCSYSYIYCNLFDLGVCRSLSLNSFEQKLQFEHIETRHVSVESISKLYIAFSILLKFFVDPEVRLIGGEWTLQLFRPFKNILTLFTITFIVSDYSLRVSCCLCNEHEFKFASTATFSM